MTFQAGALKAYCAQTLLAAVVTTLHAVAVQAKRVDAELILYVFAPATSDDTPTPPDKVCGTDDCTDGAWHGCTDAALMSTDEVWRCSRKAQQCR